MVAIFARCSRAIKLGSHGKRMGGACDRASEAEMRRVRYRARRFAQNRIIPTRSN